MTAKKPDNEIFIPSEFARLLDRDWREAIVEGGRYSLKSHTVATILLIRAMQAKERILCGREFQNSINESVHQLFSDLIDKYQLGMFKVTRDSIINTQNGSDFIFKGVKHNAQSIKSIEGVTIFWGEESQTFSRDSIDIITPTVRQSGSQLIWTMNRFTELDAVYERIVINKLPNSLHIKANYDVAEKYGWLPDEIKAEIEHDKANDPQLYQFKWLGEPLSQIDNAIISRIKAMDAMNRTIEPDGAIEVGVDVARFGADRSTFYKRKGLKIVGHDEHSKLSLTDLAERLESFVDFDKGVRIKVDDGGLGGGLTDIMKQRGYDIVPCNFGAAPSDKDKYNNLISEAWFYLQGIIDTVQLPNDPDLLMELTTRRWKMDSKGRRVVESKDDYKKRGYRSPDKADGLLLAFYSPEVPTIQFYGSLDRGAEPGRGVFSW